MPVIEAPGEPISGTTAVGRGAGFIESDVEPMSDGRVIVGAGSGILLACLAIGALLLLRLRARR